MPGEFPDVERDAFLAKVDELEPDLFRGLHPREPREFGGPDALPAIALLWISAPDEDHQTGPATQITWTFRCNVYADSSRSYEDAQIDIERCVPRLLQAIRKDRSLGVAGLRATLVDPGGEPEFNDEEQIAWKTLRLEILREETS